MSKPMTMVRRCKRKSLMPRSFPCGTWTSSTNVLRAEDTPAAVLHCHGTHHGLLDGRCEWNRLAAVCAAPGCNGDLAKALGAGFGDRRRGGNGLLEAIEQRVDGQHHREVNHAGNDEERNGGIEKVADVDWSAVHLEDDVLEVGRANDSRNELREDIFYQRCDDCTESSADDDGDSQIDDIPAENKIAKTFQHRSCLLTLWMQCIRPFRVCQPLNVLLDYGYKKRKTAMPRIISSVHSKIRTPA